MSVRSDLVQLAKPRMTEAEAIREAREAGVQLTILGPETYRVEGPAGQFLYEGAAITDECFIVDPIGTVNITKAWRVTRDLGPIAPERFPIDAALLEHINTTEVDEERIAGMTMQRRNLPVMLALVPSGVYVIDGAHRIQARARLGLKWARGYLLSAEAVERIRVRMWKLLPGGERREVDTTKGYYHSIGAHSS
jgi:hypothetical protein